MYLGYRGKTILWINSAPSKAENTQVLELDEKLSKLTHDQILNGYEIWRGQVVSKSTQKDPKNLKAAFISVYKIHCGISTYSEWLWEKMGPLFKDFQIFAEEAPDSTPDPKVTRCWKRGQATTALIKAIHAYDPDVVYIQHEYGIFPNARRWLSLLTELQQKYRTIVTLHSVYRDHHDKIVYEAPVQNIVVHTDIAAKCLKEHKGVPGKIHVVRHGSHPNDSSPKYFNIYRSKYTIVQFGFGFRYKGWHQALEVIAKLKPEFPDVFFTGLFSESPHATHEHEVVFSELSDLIHKLGIEENVGLVRGFQNDYVLKSYLKTNQIAMFPYIENGEHTVLGCSGAARIAMAHGIPTVVTHVPMFDDLTGVCPRPDSIDGIAAEIRKLFDPKAAKEQIARQDQFLESTSWDRVAAHYVELANP